MAVTLTAAEFDRLQGRKFSDDKDITAALEGLREERESEAASALGGGYQIGSKVMPPVHLGVFPLLEIIESSFLDPDKCEHTLRDIMNAVYVLFKGRDVVRPLSSIARRRERLATFKPDASKDPNGFRIWLDKIDELELEFTAFEDGAAAFWDEVGATSIQEVASTVVAALNHAASGFAAFPGTGDPEKKSSATMRSFWRRCASWPARALRHLTP